MKVRSLRSPAVALAALVTLGVAATASAGDPVFRIRTSRDYQAYTQAELQRRVWELERAVAQLQQRIYAMESAPVPVALARWTCTATAFGRMYTFTSDSRGEAAARATQRCVESGNGAMFCEPTCAQ